MISARVRTARGPVEKAECDLRIRNIVGGSCLRGDAAGKAREWGTAAAVLAAAAASGEAKMKAMIGVGEVRVRRG